MLKTTIVDRSNGARIEGIVGNNFSSYVADYDFSVLLPAHNKDRSGFSVPKVSVNCTENCSNAS